MGSDLRRIRADLPVRGESDINVMTVLKNTVAMTAVLLAVLTAGCVQTRQSEPKRTAVEERLLSRAADHALASADFAPLKDRKVYLDQTYMCWEPSETS